MRSDSTYLNTWESINQKLIETNGGYLYVRHEADGNYIDYLADFTTVGQQTIKFGKNLLDVKSSVKGESVYTCLVPLGAKNETTEERLTISSLPDETTGDIVKSGDMIYSLSAVSRFGKITQMQEWDNVTVAKNLLKKAKTQLQSGILLENSIELTAADLAGINQDIASFRIGTKIAVESNPHGMNASYLVQKLSISLSDPASNVITVGATFKGLTEQSNENLQTSISKSLNNYTTVQQVDSKIHTATTGLPTTENVVSMIGTALINYPTNDEMTNEIQTSLVGYAKTSEVSQSIATALTDYSTTAETAYMISSSLVNNAWMSLFLASDIHAQSVGTSPETSCIGHVVAVRGVVTSAKAAGTYATLPIATGMSYRPSKDIYAVGIDTSDNTRYILKIDTLGNITAVNVTLTGSNVFAFDTTFII